jgi:hypothetical protein
MVVVVVMVIFLVVGGVHRGSDGCDSDGGHDSGSISFFSFFLGHCFHDVHPFALVLTFLMILV